MIVFGGTYRDEIGTRDPEGGGMVAADITPTWGIFEDANDTEIQTGSFVARGGFTGRYRMSVALSTANGFEIFKFYSVWAETQVNSILQDAPIAKFFLMPPGLALVATVNVATGDGDFTVTAVPTITLPATNDSLNGCFCVFLTGNNKGIPRQITDYVQSTGQLLFTGAVGQADAPFPETVVAADVLQIIGLNL